MRDRLTWGAAIAFSVAISSTLLVPPIPAATASHCCLPGRPQVVFAPTPEDSEEYSLSLADIDPGYVLTKVLVPILYASLIIYIVALIQRR